MRVLLVANQVELYRFTRVQTDDVQTQVIRPDGEANQGVYAE